VLATGSPDAVVPGARVDVLVTTEHATRLALEDIEVLAARPAAASEQGGAARVTATLRVTVSDAVYLAAAHSFAREVRLLARAPGDSREVGGLSVDDGL
jgi:pilus assembly protein CpaB